jgi:acetyl esterase
VNDEPLAVPLAADCEALRQSLIDDPLPPVWSLDAVTARDLHKQGLYRLRAAWQPPLDTLPVVTEDVAADGGQVAMRAYRPVSAAEGPADRPTIMWMHGGGWVLGDLDTADAAARTACVLTGFDVVSVDYRCAPVSRFPAAADDALTAARWLLDQGRRVVVAGDSAGASLAAGVAQELGARDGLVGQVLIYPATNPNLSTASAASFIEGPFLTRRDMEWFFDQYLDGPADRSDTRVDLDRGLTRPDLEPVKTVLLTVGHDPLRDEGIAYGKRLAELGFAVTWIHAPELFHGAFTQSGVLPSSDRRVRQIWRVVRELFI